MIPCDGLVLAGGQSRRMGQAKADLRMPNGRTLLEQAWGTLNQVCQGTVWVSRPFGHLSSGPNDLVDQSPQPGPLPGIAQALAKSRHSLVAILAVDLPLIPVSLYLELYRQWERNKNCDIVYAHAGDGTEQPLAALWHKRTLPLIGELIAGPDNPRVQSVVARAESLQVDATSPSYLLNINTPQDWDSLRQVARQ